MNLQERNQVWDTIDSLVKDKKITADEALVKRQAFVLNLYRRGS